jgi:2-C-methyl-D-erythritol 4-phosphate cytidylyltransferase
MGQQERVADAVIAAAGQGKRVGARRNKLLLALGDRSVLERTLEGSGLIHAFVASGWWCHHRIAMRSKL